MLGAAQAARDEAEVAEHTARYEATESSTRRTWVDAVCRNFNPTRTMHTFLKKVDPALDVARGGWIRKSEPL